ncbi:MAG: N-acetylmuramoyl-L-alanine amidase [Paracoccaceae bacterium]|nr:N-acetylmuramoyl-L-alanine amidase [Paracoccaceae bacterium]
MTAPRRLPSPNFGDRRGGAVPSLIVLHYTATATAEAAAAILSDPALEVSAHYLLDVTGEVCLMVDEDKRAWHAGRGSWQGQDDVNSRSIGIEIVNSGAAPFPEPQMAALEDLIAGIMARWRIAPAGVIAHSDMAPDRKIDPGPRFDWRRLARAGLAVWPEGAGRGDPARFAADARAFGYPDVGDDLLLSAFRLRFRPWAMGPVDPWDAGLAADLARRFGRDQGH